MNLQIFHKMVIGAVTLSFGLFAKAADGDAPPVAVNVFDRCQFTMRETEHLKLKVETSWSDAGLHTCAIHLKPTNDFALSGTVSFFIFGIDQYIAERESGVVGFIQDSHGKWLFQGTKLLLSPKIIKKTFTQEQREDETLLVGHQVIRGMPPNGGSIDIPGIRILRIKPEFVTSLETNFNFLLSAKPTFVTGYKQLYEAFNKELVEIVRSVEVAPGLPGPTVMHAPAP